MPRIIFENKNLAIISWGAGIKGYALLMKLSFM